MKKKVLFIIRSFSTGGGAQSLLTRIVNNLNQDKYEISIIEILHNDMKTENVRPEITVLPYIMRADDPERKEKCIMSITSHGRYLMSLLATNMIYMWRLLI